MTRFLIPLAALVLLASAAGAQTPADGTILERTPCAPLVAYEQVAVLTRASGREPPPEAEYRRLERGTVCERLVYASDGLRVVAILIRPARPEGRRMPVLIFNHGSGVDGAVPEGVTLDEAHWVADGYLFLAPQLRGIGGSEGRVDDSGADAHDVLNLYPLLRQLPYADTTNIFMQGHSRGGTMTLLALRAGMPVRAAAVTATRAEHANPERSAVAWPERITAPLLMLHGDADATVPVAPIRRLAAQLDSLGRTHELVVYRGGDHNLTRHGDDVRRRVQAWFRRYRAR